jgi:hypothetical protein
MKLTIPLEYRIQQKGEKYADNELIGCALEVHSLQLDLKEAKASNFKLTAWLTALTLILVGASFLHGLGKL